MKEQGKEESGDREYIPSESVKFPVIGCLVEEETEVEENKTADECDNFSDSIYEVARGVIGKIPFVKQYWCESR